MFFQQLSEEIQSMIFEGIRRDEKLTDEETDHYINCNNTREDVKRWVIKYYLEADR